jgi:hypothetical protein
MKISNTVLAIFQLMNEMSAKVTNNFTANLDYLFTSVELNHKIVTLGTLPPLFAVQNLEIWEVLGSNPRCHLSF